ncbi:hypothetical protein GC089_05060 [Cellulomonas sp. JZ18]|uniref:hypothetical protein n=1 Tax=Cellulomonas sp. JZ18 TaxID=2654191 RepID=UPI0012D3815A|nr:hypothetical protein [Cellulomonas sp. JZ18]QGQ18732.1 hypothetical protein GC089_05060 [Cellulomonas sp. JZ18]
MSTDETRPLPVGETQPLPLDETRPLPTDAGTAAARDADGPDGDEDAADGTRRDRVRVGTVVWGVVIALLGVGVLLVAAGYTIDLELAAIGLLVLAGLGLIVGPLLASARRRGGDDAARR